MDQDKWTKNVHHFTIKDVFCAKGEHLIVLSPLDDVDSRHLEYLVSERALGWGKKHKRAFTKQTQCPLAVIFFFLFFFPKKQRSFLHKNKLKGVVIN